MPFNLRSHYLYKAASAQPPALPVFSNYGSRLGGGRTQRRYLSPTSSPAIGFLFISSLFGVCAPWCGEVKIQFLEGRGGERARARAGAGGGAPHRYPHSLNAWRKPNSRSLSMVRRSSPAGTAWSPAGPSRGTCPRRTRPRARHCGDTPRGPRAPGTRDPQRRIGCDSEMRLDDRPDPPARPAERAVGSRCAQRHR